MAPRQQRGQRPESGAAQPASSRDGDAQPASTGDPAQLIFSELPRDASELTVAYYNVGIDESQVGAKSWKDKEKALAKDIVKAVNVHGLDILCLSELGEIDVGLGDELHQIGIPGGDIRIWIRKILADSTVSPVSIHVDAHYATLVLSKRITILKYRLIDGFLKHHKYRCFQHFRVCTNEREEPISIVNCHAPSNSKRTERKLTVTMRKKYLEAFHEACADDPFIWGGDFNTRLLALTDYLENLDDRYKVSGSSAAQPGSLQIVFSNPLSFIHGDIAVTFGLCCAQENSTVGKSFRGASDRHDEQYSNLHEQSPESAPQRARRTQ